MVTLSFERRCKPSSLARKIADITGVPQSEQLLRINGNLLNCGYQELVLEPGDCVQMLLRVNGGAKKKPKGTRSAGVNVEKRELVFKEDGQEYARCSGLLGNRRISMECMDGVQRLGLIRGSMKRGAANRVRTGDLVLVGLRDYQDEKADVIHKYDIDEVHRLKAYGEIEAGFKLNENEDKATGFVSDDDDDIEFNFSDGDIDAI